MKLLQDLGVKTVRGMLCRKAQKNLKKPNKRLAMSGSFLYTIEDE